MLLLLLPVAKEGAHTGIEDVFGLSQDVIVHGRDAADEEESADSNVPLVGSAVVDRSIALSASAARSATGCTASSSQLHMTCGSITR